MAADRTHIADVDSVKVDGGPTSGLTLPLVLLETLSARTVEMHMFGDIDGEEFAAALTCGDGSCDLQAWVGIPEQYGSSSVCINTRPLLVEHLPEALPTMSAACILAARELLFEILDDVCREQAL